MTTASTNLPHVTASCSLKAVVKAALNRVFSLQPEDPEEARLRRAFIQDVLESNPQAFTGDVDVLCMMHTYPGRF